MIKLKDKYNVIEIGNLFKAGPECIRSWIRKGKIKAKFEKRSFYVYREEVVNLINSALSGIGADDMGFNPIKDRPSQMLGITVCSKCGVIIETETTRRYNPKTTAFLIKRVCEECKNTIEKIPKD